MATNVTIDHSMDDGINCPPRQRRRPRPPFNGIPSPGRWSLALVAAATALLVGTADPLQAQEAPAWRGTQPGTQWLGPDVLWRPREWLVFHLHDDQGGGFALDLTVRDLNVYMQGERPVAVSVVGPDDRVLTRRLLPDDGIGAGDHRYKDGMYDVFADFRYREWHRVHSPGGRPPGKARSPYLERPRELPARTLRLEVPDGGAGLYRVLLIASWDHFVSLTPDRPLRAGVHPGPGPLSVHGDRLEAAYLWIPSSAEHLGVSLMQEDAPFGATLGLYDQEGRAVATRQAQGPLAYIVDENPSGDSVYKVSVRDAGPGAGLHIRGVPPVLAPDAETARLLHGGLHIDAAGRPTLHRHQRLLDRWTDGLTAAQRADSLVAAAIKGIDALRRLSPFYWYDTRDLQYRHAYRAGSPFTAPLRSGWYSLGLDSRAALALRPTMESGVLPDSVVAAWQTSLKLWAEGRRLMHMGETANQWTYNLAQLAQILDITGDAETEAIIRRDIKRLTTTGSLGRLDPDGPADTVDLGRTPAGYMAEQMGWDGQYGQEQEQNLAKLWPRFTGPGFVDWLQDLYWLKSHIALPKGPLAPQEPFSGLTSPTDFNFRTRYAAHKTGLPEGLRDTVVFGDLWRPHAGKAAQRPWPALADSAFVRSVDGQFHFIKTARYYAQFYSGHRAYDWTQFSRATVEEDSGGGKATGRGGHVRLKGYNGPGYGGFGRKSTNVGALSSLSANGVGPVLMAQNHGAWDANVVWGRQRNPVMPVWEREKVDPTIVSSGYAQPQARFDTGSRTYRLREELLYAPLVVERSLAFKDDRIEVALRLRATANLDLAELYLALPFVSDDRRIRLYGADYGVRPWDTPPAVLTSMKKTEPALEETRFGQGMLEGIRAFGVTGADGSGATVVFGRPLDLMPVAPLRYREVATATASFNAVLQGQMEAGEEQTLRYTIYLHAGPLPEAVLQAGLE